MWGTMKRYEERFSQRLNCPITRNHEIFISKRKAISDLFPRGMISKHFIRISNSSLVWTRARSIVVLRCWRINDRFPINGNCICLYSQEVQRLSRLTQKFSPVQKNPRRHSPREHRYGKSFATWRASCGNFSFGFAQSATATVAAVTAVTSFLHQFAIFVISVFDYNFLKRKNRPSLVAQYFD